MPRRKQNAPQARLGPVEGRDIIEDTEQQVASGDEWDEEEELLYQRQSLYIRQPKRKKTNDKRAAVQHTTVNCRLYSDKRYWFANVECNPTSNKSKGMPTETVDNMTLTWVSNSNKVITVAIGDFKGTITLPSSEVYQAFMQLIKNDYIALGFPEEVGTSSSRATSRKFQFPVQLGEQTILRNGMEDDEPDDESRPQWQSQLLLLLKALMEDSPLVDKEAEEEHADSTGENFNAAALYELIKPLGNEPAIEIDFPELKPTLRGYQRRAAMWMLNREKGNDSAAAKQKDELHPLWRKIECPLSNDSFYINFVTGKVCFTEFTWPESPRGGILADEMGLGKTVSMLALILANKYTGPPPTLVESACEEDGHTARRIDCVCGEYTPLESDSDDSDEVEVGMYEVPYNMLECSHCKAYLHRECVGRHRNHGGSYVCPPCQRSVAQGTVTQPCETTLIVVPQSLIHQWYEEIHRHIHDDTLTVVIYEGQAQVGKQRSVVKAAHLAAADIVLCSYETLRKDVYRQPDLHNENMTLRHKKRYDIIPTPLTRLEFWRVCLDESQMIESSTAASAYMALKLRTVHRWCITGTPVSRGLHDIYGLMAFLRAKPFDSKFWWNWAIEAPYNQGDKSGLVKLLKPSLGGLMWRSSKASVADELGLPPQHQHIINLTFPSIERHFYQQQHSSCADAARRALPFGLLAAASRSGFEDRPLTHREMDKLLHPLLMLRQACVHPQVGGSGIQQSACNPMPMSGVLDVMITKAKVEAEDAQRILIAALNGLAGLYQLKEEWVEASKMYREVLSLVKKNDGFVHTDALQRLHTLTNLDALLKDWKGLQGIARTLDDDKFETMAQELRDGYLVEALSKLKPAEDEYEEAEKAAQKIKDDLQKDFGSSAVGLMNFWWIEAVQMLTAHTHDDGEAVCRHIKDSLLQEDDYRQKVHLNASNLGKRFRKLLGLQLIVTEEMKALDQAFQASFNELEKLGQALVDPPASMVQLAGSCGRCRNERNAITGNLCHHCKLDEMLVSVEVRLFHLRCVSKQASARFSIEEAVKQYHLIQLRNMVGFGGIGETQQQNYGGMPSRHQAVATDVYVTHKASQMEVALKLLHHHLRQLKVPAALEEKHALIVAVAEAHVEQLEAYRKLFLKARALCTTQRLKLYALDELNQCTMKFSLRQPDDPWMIGDEIYKVTLPEIPIRHEDLCNERAVSENDLAQRVGRLRFLLGLKEAKRNENDPLSPVKTAKNTCPICLNQLDTELGMLPCGHDMCCVCMMRMVEAIHPSIPEEAKQVACPVCRTRSLVSDIAFVTGETSTQHASYVDGTDESNIQVKGSYGVKIESVVRRLLYLAQTNPDERVLVFSTWKDALELLSHALNTNNVAHLFPKTAASFNKAIAEFRQESATYAPGAVLGQAAPATTSTRRKTKKSKTAAPGEAKVLLLQVRQGGNGLNLQHGNCCHIIFLHPLLDPAEQAQSIGRIDRIGQTRPTHIHSFVISNSIEENVHRLGRERAAGMDMSAAVVVKNNAVKGGGALSVKDVAMLLQSGGSRVS